jgi:hypothetical protein
MKRMGRHAWHVLLTVTVGGALLLSAQVAPRANGAGALATEAQVKVAFLYNFAKFVRWPSSALGAKGEPIRIGIIEDAPLGDAIHMVEGKTAQKRKVEFRTCSTFEEMRNCHILYLNTEDDLLAKSVLTRLQVSPVLTVGDGPAFCRWGGMIAFHSHDQHWHFTARQAAAEKAGLKISAKLLQVADLYKEKEKP